MKTINDDKQMKNVWEIPLCRGEERIMIDGKKLTQHKNLSSFYLGLLFPHQTKEI